MPAEGGGMRDEGGGRETLRNDLLRIFLASYLISSRLGKLRWLVLSRSDARTGDDPRFQ